MAVIVNVNVIVIVNDQHYTLNTKHYTTIYEKDLCLCRAVARLGVALGWENEGAGGLEYE